MWYMLAITIVCVLGLCCIWFLITYPLRKRAARIDAERLDAAMVSLKKMQDIILKLEQERRNKTDKTMPTQ